MDGQQRGHVHQTLRQATQAAHHALDHHPLLQRLTGSGLTREQYAESLAAMHRPHARLERQVHESRHWIDAGIELPARRLLLEADLLELGWPLPRHAPVPLDRLEEPADWWGRVYVLEGSRLGGALLARCIRSSLGAGAPCRFFGAATLPGFHRALMATLERELQGDDDLERAAASARAAFADYKAKLDAFDGRKRDHPIQAIND